MKRLVRHVIRKFGFDIVRFSPDQMGRNPLEDMGKFIHNEHPLVFDVGANVGQSIERFRSQFPTCAVHSFEPSPASFQELQLRSANLKNVRLWNCAIGSAPGQMNLLENSNSLMSSFLPLSEFGWGKVTRETSVEIKTLDQFCHDENIEQIDILKLDTQGFELEVLKGAEGAIHANIIGLVYVEIIFSDMYKGLPPFTKIYDFLTSRDFLLVSFYPFFYQKRLAGWTDALFIHKSYIRG